MFKTKSNTPSTPKRKLLGLLSIPAVFLGMLVWPVAVAAPANAAGIVCHTVTVKPYEPWYRCVPISPTHRLPPGCYTTQKTVCD